MRSATGSIVLPGETATERDSFSEVVLAMRLREVIRRLSPAIPDEVRAVVFILEIATFPIEGMANPMGDDKRKVITAALITQMRKSVTIDWKLREGA